MKLTFFLQDLENLKEYIKFSAKINTPLPESKQTLKEIYKAAQDSGLPSPLDNPPTYPNYLEEYHSLFYDILHFKTEFDSFMPLSLIETYQNLIDVKIPSFIIRLIIQFDRVHTMSINEILKGNSK